MLDAELDSHLDNENTKKPPMETTVTDTELRRLSHPLANPKPNEVVRRSQITFYYF